MVIINCQPPADYVVKDDKDQAAKAAYYQLAAVENISKTTEQNIKDAYEAELAKLPEFHLTVRFCCAS
jgi:hypothetical protein